MACFVAGLAKQSRRSALLYTRNRLGGYISTAKCRISTQYQPAQDLVNSLSRGGFETNNPEETYDLWAQSYTKDVEQLGFHSPGTCAEYAIRFWPTSFAKEVQVADIGCGTGLVAKLITKKLTVDQKDKVRFNGMDLSEEMLSQAEATGLYHRLKKGSVGASWPITDKSMDLAVCNGVLIYCSPHRATLDEFVRILKPMGHAVIMIRMDQLKEWKPFIGKLEEEGVWTLVAQSPVYNNFSAPRAFDAPVFYKQFVFRVER